MTKAYVAKDASGSVKMGLILLKPASPVRLFQRSNPSLRDMNIEEVRVEDVLRHAAPAIEKMRKATGGDDQLP
ncbi:MAG: hypothetical protein AB7O43_00880 [Hyphomicrobiaceae bacterium]